MIKARIVGFYRVIPTKESILQAVSYHEYDWLLDERGEYADEILWGNFENLGLLEMQVYGTFAPSVLLEVISHADQAPYLEFYLDPNGQQLLSENEASEMEDCRICFYLHFVDHTIPLMVDQTEFSLPPWSELPERLEPFVHYLPPD